MLWSSGQGLPCLVEFYLTVVEFSSELFYFFDPSEQVQNNRELS